MPPASEADVKLSPKRGTHCCGGKANGETCHVEPWFFTLRQPPGCLISKTLSFFKCAENHLDAVFTRRR